MGTEIFKMDASWAEKLTKRRVQFLLTPTVAQCCYCQLWISRSSQPKTQDTRNDLYLIVQDCTLLLSLSPSLGYRIINASQILTFRINCILHSYDGLQNVDHINAYAGLNFLPPETQLMICWNDCCFFLSLYMQKAEVPKL